MTAADILFADRALRGHIHMRRDQEQDGSRYLVFWKQKGSQRSGERRFRLDGNTLELVSDDG